MKAKKSKIDMRLTHYYIENVNGIISKPITYCYEFKSTVQINKDNFEFYSTIDKPETISEFLCRYGLKKKDLVKWLNDNYK